MAMRRLVLVIVLLLPVGAAADRLRAPDGSIRDVPPESVEFALRDGYARIATVTMRAPGGIALYDVDEDLVRGFESAGFWKLTPSEVDAVQGRPRGGDTVNMRAPEGRTYGIPLRQVPAYASQGFRVETDKESIDRVAAETLREAHRDADARGTPVWLALSIIGGGLLIAVLLMRWWAGRLSRDRSTR